MASSGHRRKSSAAKSKHTTSSISAPEITPLQANVNAEKKVDESNKQTEFENTSKQAMHTENSESQNHMPNVSDTMHSEFKFASNTENNKMTENTAKLENKENDAVNNENSAQDTEKSDNLISKVQRSQLENIEARYLFIYSVF